MENIFLFFHFIGPRNSNFEDSQFERRAYDPWVAYGQSKTANILFTVGLEQRDQGLADLQLGDDGGDIDAGIWTVGTAMGLINDILDMAKIEAHPRMEGRQMLMVLAPK